MTRSITLVLLSLCAGAAAAAPGTQAAPDDAVAREALALHNRERERVGVPALAWDRALAGLAREWAQKLCRSGVLQHRPARPGGPGENLWQGASTEPGAMPIAEAVASWAGEQRGFDARTGRCRGVCGHYTQMVWRGTTHLGCGEASCRAGGMSSTIWVCNYRPAGNIMGERPF